MPRKSDRNPAISGQIVPKLPLAVEPYHDLLTPAQERMWFGGCPGSRSFDSRSGTDVVRWLSRISGSRSKRQIGVEVRDPGREQQVLRNLSEANHGPLPDESLQNIYGSILAAMRDLQAPD